VKVASLSQADCKTFLRKDTERNPAWMRHARAVRTELGLTSELCPWSSLGKTLLGPLTGDRYRECLDIAFLDRMLNSTCSDKSPDNLVRGFYCDISQGVQMKKWGVVESLNKGLGAQHSSRFTI
jgi:hypothetical protein